MCFCIAVANLAFCPIVRGGHVKLSEVQLEDVIAGKVREKDPTWVGAAQTREPSANVHLLLYSIRPPFRSRTLRITFASAPRARTSLPLSEQSLDLGRAGLTSFRFSAKTSTSASGTRRMRDFTTRTPLPTVLTRTSSPSRPRTRSPSTPFSRRGAPSSLTSPPT